MANCAPERPRLAARPFLGGASTISPAPAALAAATFLRSSLLTRTRSPGRGALGSKFQEYSKSTALCCTAAGKQTTPLPQPLFEREESTEGLPPRMSERPSGWGFLPLLGVAAALLAAPALGVLAPALLTEASLGIDLGTTFSVAAVCQAGVVSVVQARRRRHRVRPAPADAQPGRAGGWPFHHSLRRRL